MEEGLAAMGMYGSGAGNTIVHSYDRAQPKKKGSKKACKKKAKEKTKELN